MIDLQAKLEALNGHWEGLRRAMMARMACSKGQFALDIAIGLAIVLVISAFVVLPSLKTLSGTFFTDMSKWWSSTMSSHLFSTSGN